MKLKVAVCGTRSGYNNHLQRKEETCEPCKKASRVWVATWSKANPDRVREQNKKAREKYRAKPETKLKRREYAQRIAGTLEGADKLLRSVHRRRARKMSSPTEKYTSMQVILLYGAECHICLKEIDLNAPRSMRTAGWEIGLQIDHVIPIARGGGDVLDNVRPSHGLCNTRKGSR